ncbi:MAG TPA: histidine kinase [Cyanobacteria bacterium UBA11369]|nr:histidine kinase [Cyanobacteria bacterium UBA11371]HBE33338.1 histidine kinase [Cyanobacteria bacterium UBA11368]HBE49561.1 histidine kinase [Cyanobacteria bacterium UBA11369]
MQFDHPLIFAPAVEAAIDHEPPIVTPDTPLVNAIALMNQTRLLVPQSGGEASETLTAGAKLSSYILVMQNTELLGIFTERDIVQLTAAGVNFEGVQIGAVMTQAPIVLRQADFHDISAALFLFRRYRIRHLPIVSDNGFPIGVVSPESIRRVLRPANFLKRRRVSELMSTEVIHAPVTASVLSLAQLMASHDISCVAIAQEDEEGNILPVGIVTERDIVQLQSLQIDFARTQAQTVMSTPLFLLSPEDSLYKAYQEMQQRHVRRLVVSWNWGQGLGIITETDLLRVFDPIEMYGTIEILQRTIEQLKREQAELSQRQNNQLEALVTSDITHCNQCSNANHELNDLLSTIQVCIESLAQQPDLSPDLRQTKLNSALVDIERMRHLVEALSQT